MRIKLIVSQTTRDLIVAALLAYDMPNVAGYVAAQKPDPADDGPEVAILSVDGAGWGS